MTGNFLTFKDFGQNVRANSNSSVHSNSRSAQAESVNQARIAKNIFEEVSKKELSDESQKKVNDIFDDGVIDQDEMKLLNEVLDEVMEGLHPDDYEDDVNYEFVSALRIATEDGVVNDREMRRINTTASQIKNGAEVAVSKERLDEIGLADGIISTKNNGKASNTNNVTIQTSFTPEGIEARYGSTALSSLEGMTKDELANEVNTAKADYATIGVEINNLASQQATAEASRKTASERLSSLKTDISTADSELQKTNTEIEKLEKTVGDKKEKIEQFTAEQIDPINKKIADKDAELKTAQDNVTVAKATKAAADERKTNADNAFNAASDNYNSALATYNSMPDTITVQDGEDEDGNPIYKEVPNQEKIDYKNNELANAEAQKLAAKAEQEAATEAQTEANNDLTAKQTSENKISDELDVLKNVTLVNAQKALDDYKATLDEDEKALVEQYQKRSEYEAQKTSAEAMLDDANGAIADAEAQIASIKEVKRGLIEARPKVAKYRQNASIKISRSEMTSKYSRNTFAS